MTTAVNPTTEPAVAVPAMQLREIIELMTTMADGRENASHQTQARLMANGLQNRLNDAQKESA